MLDEIIARTDRTVGLTVLGIAVLTVIVGSVVMPLGDWTGTDYFLAVLVLLWGIIFAIAPRASHSTVLFAVGLFIGALIVGFTLGIMAAPATVFLIGLLVGVVVLLIGVAWVNRQTRAAR